MVEPSATTREDGGVMERRSPILATDLDGTLLRSDGTIGQRTRDALHAADVAGLLMEDGLRRAERREARKKAHKNAHNAHNSGVEG